MPDESQLVARAQSGDIEAFEALVEMHRDGVYALALRLTQSDADAAEVAQDTFLAAYQNLPRFRAEATFGSWIYRIAANNAYMRLRRQRVRSAAEEALEEPDFTEHGTLSSLPSASFARHGRSAEELALNEELKVAIQKATEALPDGYREVFLLRDVEGLSYEEIAEMTELTVPAVRSRLHRARLALREAIDAFYNSR